MPSHGPKGNPHKHRSHNSHGRPHREGILGLLDKVSEFREQAGTRVREGVEATGRQARTGVGLLDRAMRFVGENPLDFLPGTGEAMALQDARESFGEGRPGMGLLSAVGALPGIPRIPRGLFGNLEELQGTGFRMFARSEEPGLRTVASITPDPKRPGSVKVSLFDESAEFGASELPTNTLDFDSVDEAVEALSGGRKSLEGFSEINLARPEFSFDRAVERAAAQRARESGGDPGLLRALVEGRQRPGGIGGFRNPRPEPIGLLSPPPSRRVVDSAFRSGDQVIVAPRGTSSNPGVRMHVEVLNSLPEDLKKLVLEGAEEGFVDELGNFVTRVDAVGSLPDFGKFLP
ncbi:MAG: hypothetical protein V3S55_10140 [Nitrospiraceae bacterium]